MKSPWNKDKRTDIERLIDEQLIEQAKLAKTPKEMNEIVELYERRQKGSKTLPVSADTIAIIAGNLLGIGLILGHEKLNVISTKALGFVIKGRV